MAEHLVRKIYFSYFSHNALISLKKAQLEELIQSHYVNVPNLTETFDIPHLITTLKKKDMLPSIIFNKAILMF